MTEDGWDAYWIAVCSAREMALSRMWYFMRVRSTLEVLGTVLRFVESFATCGTVVALLAQLEGDWRVVPVVIAGIAAATAVLHQVLNPIALATEAASLVEAWDRRAKVWGDVVLSCRDGRYSGPYGEIAAPEADISRAEQALRFPVISKWFQEAAKRAQNAPETLFSRVAHT